MAIPLHYITRNVWARRLTATLAAGGLGLVVFVFATVLMLDTGLKQVMVKTGERDNVVLIRKGAETEVQSLISRFQAAAMETHPLIAMSGDGRPMASREAVVLFSLTRTGYTSPSNLVIRGESPLGVPLRPQIRVKAGRVFESGSTEVIVGHGIAAGYDGMRIGNSLRFGHRNWTIVGHFDAGGSSFDSEIWGDVDQIMQSFRRNSYSSMVVRLSNTTEFDKFRADIDMDPRLANEAKAEQAFYSDQSHTLSAFINILGLTLSAIFSIAAMIGAMITMYAFVANRLGEIGTLRALGFQRANVLIAFLIEAALLGLVGGAAGLLCASLMQFVSFSTVNFQTFSDLSFRFVLTPVIVVKSLLFAIAMGLVGGFLPALRASWIPIVATLRAR